MKNTKRKMNARQLTVVVFTNMVGSGIVMLPAELARVGTISILSWLVTAFGSLALAYGFANAGVLNKKHGGIGAYAEYGFGKAGNFISNYTYAVSLLIANTAIAISTISYICVFLNITLTPSIVATTTIIVLWIASVLNFGEPRTTGKIGSVTVLGVLLPIFGVFVFGIFFFDKDLYLKAWNPHSIPFFKAVSNSIAITLWGFLGLESASANVDAVANPKRDIPLACLGGTVAAGITYIVSTNIVAGIVPNGDLLNSNAPFGLVFSTMFNPFVGKIIMVLMIMACFGSLLSWQFTIGRVFKVAADMGHLPKVFKKINSSEAPVLGIMIITTAQSLLTLMTINQTLIKQFYILVDLAVTMNLVPFILTMMALNKIQKQEGVIKNKAKIVNIIAFIATLYSFYALYTTGFSSIVYGSLATLGGFIFYVLLIRHKKF